MMKRNFYILTVLLFLTGTLSAHPLGNFSINQYSRIEVEKSRIAVRQILDLAEIPTFQEQSAIDADRDGTLSAIELEDYAEKLTPQILANIFLSVDGRPIRLTAESNDISLRSGAGNLPTLRVEWNFTGEFSEPDAVARVRFENKNHADRIGWNEIVLSRVGGVIIFDSSAFGSGVTDELKTYPAESLDAPLAERSATFTFSTGGFVPENSKPLVDRDGRANAPVAKDKLAELIAVPEITPEIALFGLVLAFAMGALHALSPGHGKAIVGAYLVGSRGTAKHAAFLGLTVTVTHTLGVFALGLITLFASNYILPETLLPFLSFVSGLLVLYLGLTMFKSRLFSVLGRSDAGHHDHHSHVHDHRHHDGHDHEHHASGEFTHTHDGRTHSHLPPSRISWKSLLALGVSGGLLPCPSALVLMLSAINLQRAGYGLILTTAFSFGLAATLTTVGLIFLYGGKLLGGSKIAESRIVKTLPVASAFVIACLGAIICYNSLG